MASELQDDLTVTDATKLLRRIPAAWVHEGVPEGSAFKPDKEPDALGTSVTIWQSYADEENVMRGWPGYGLLVVTMKECRAAGLGIIRTRLDDNPNHCELFGPKAPANRRKLSKGARWRVYPDTVPEELRGPVEERE